MIQIKDPSVDATPPSGLTGKIYHILKHTQQKRWRTSPISSFVSANQSLKKQKKHSETHTISFKEEENFKFIHVFPRTSKHLKVWRRSMKISVLTKANKGLCFTESLETKWGPASAQCRELAEVSRRPGFYFWTLGKTAAAGGWGDFEKASRGIIKVNQSVQTSHAKSNYLDQWGVGDGGRGEWGRAFLSQWRRTKNPNLSRKGLPVPAGGVWLPFTPAPEGV